MPSMLLCILPLSGQQQWSWWDALDYFGIHIDCMRPRRVVLGQASQVGTAGADQRGLEGPGLFGQSPHVFFTKGHLYFKIKLLVLLP